MADVAAPSPDNDPSAMAGSAPTDSQASAPQASDSLPAEVQDYAGPNVDDGSGDDQVGPIPSAAAPDNLDPAVGPAPADTAATTTAAAPTAAAPNGQTPSIAATLDVPASDNPGDGSGVPDGSGGEWELLVQKVSHWISSGALQQQWQVARTPLSLLAGLIALLLVLRIYGALLAVIDSLPLLPGLLELAGVIAVTRFGLRRLLRSQERAQLISSVRARWQAFRGQR